MNNNDWEDRITYKILVNHEEQYSIWPADRGGTRWDGP